MKIIYRRRGHTWHFKYDDRRELLRQLGRMACREDLPFSWWDAFRVTVLVNHPRQYRRVVA